MDPQVYHAACIYDCWIIRKKIQPQHSLCRAAVCRAYKTVLVVPRCNSSEILQPNKNCFRTENRFSSETVYVVNTWVSPLWEWMCVCVSYEVIAFLHISLLSIVTQVIFVYCALQKNRPFQPLWAFCLLKYLLSYPTSIIFQLKGMVFHHPLMMCSLKPRHWCLHMLKQLCVSHKCHRFNLSVFRPTISI